MNLVDIQMPTPDVRSVEAQQALAMAKCLVLDSADMAQIASDELVAVKARHEALDAERKKMTDPLREAEKSINDFFRPALDFYKDAEKALKARLTAYQVEQKRIAQEAQAKADAAAAAERARLAAEAAEIERAARQKAEQEAAAIRAKEAAAEAASAEDRAKLQAEADAQRQASAMEAAKAQQAAQDLQIRSMSVVTAIVAAPAVAGTTLRGTWKAEVTDKAKALAFCAENPAYQNIFEVSPSALNALARAQKEHLKIPGVRVHFDQTVASRKGAA